MTPVALFFSKQSDRYILPVLAYRVTFPKKIWNFNVIWDLLGKVVNGWIISKLFWILTGF